MLQRLHRQTTPQPLLHILTEIILWNELSEFRLVGGTALSLQLGHRISVDLDLFTDAIYGSVDFEPIYRKLKCNFSYVLGNPPDNKSFGCSYLIGNSSDDCVKVDFYYTDPFLFSPVEIDQIRMADVRDIAVMKLDVISNGGRKKDFWDVSEIVEYYSLSSLLDLYVEKYPYYTVSEVLSRFTDFSLADDMENPICLRGKYWELIKLDLMDLVNSQNLK